MTDDKWEEIYFKALSKIYLSLSNEVLRKVAKQTAVADLWLKLDSLYITKSMTNRLLLKSRLYDLSLADSKQLYLIQMNSSL